MPNIYNVQLQIVVPGLGSRVVPFVGISGLDIDDAVKQAIATVIVEAIAVQKTA